MPKEPKTKPRYVVEEIPLDSIDVEEQQVRDIQVDDEIHELASSIDALDLLQFPGVIRKADGRFDLAWGRRRLEAFRLRQCPTIPCRVYEGELTSIKALALVENLQRRAMSIAEECAGVIYLFEEKKLPIDTIVKQLGRTRSWVLTRLAVPSFPADIREALILADIGIGAAEALALCVDDSARAYILSQAIQAKLTISEIRAMVQSSLAMPTQVAAIEAGLTSSRETHSYQRALIECAACGRPRPLERLQFVRVCNDGCQSESSDQLPYRISTNQLDSPDAESRPLIPAPDPDL
jgi:ParB/RepB/Spo0J family partition protein